jgi:uncharacterized protein YraI
MIPRKRALSLAASVALAFPLAVVSPAVVAHAHAPCGSPAPADNEPYIGYTTTDNVNMRSGTGTSCRSNGLAQRGQRLDYHCATWDRHVLYRWVYARNVSTGVEGWIRGGLVNRVPASNCPL